MVLSEWVLDEVGTRLQLEQLKTVTTHTLGRFSQFTITFVIDFKFKGEIPDSIGDLKVEAFVEFVLQLSLADMNDLLEPTLSQSLVTRKIAEFQTTDHAAEEYTTVQTILLTKVYEKVRKYLQGSEELNNFFEHYVEGYGFSHEYTTPNSGPIYVPPIFDGLSHLEKRYTDAAKKLMETCDSD